MFQIIMDKEVDWVKEALDVIYDVRAHVKNMHMTDKLMSSCGMYMNVTTKEGQEFCVHLCPAGFQVVGLKIDCKDLEDNNPETYETPYAFLNKVSPSYRQSFGNLLVQKLNEECEKSNEECEKPDEECEKSNEESEKQNNL